MHCGMAMVKLRCIMGCQGLKSSYQEKDLFRGNSFLCLILFICFYFGVLEAFAHSEFAHAFCFLYIANISLF